MDEDKDCLYGKYGNGEYIVAKSNEASDALIDWIRQIRFKDFEKEIYRLKKPCRPRNKIYSFQVAPDSGMRIMKVSSIAHQYKLSRKIDLFLTGLYKDYSRDAFWGAKALYECGILVAKPLAFWTFKKNVFNKQSYFLCQKVSGQQTVAQWLKKYQEKMRSGDDKNLADKRLYALMEKIVDIVRKIHNCGLRHGDIHPGNFNIEFPGNSAQATDENLSQAKLYLLDYDDCSKARIRLPWLKRFFDLSDLHNLRIPGVGNRQLLTMYLGVPPASHQLKALRFWCNGGFNIRRQLSVGSRQEGRHLKQ